MDVFNIAELNRYVLLILMLVCIFWVLTATSLKKKEIEIAHIKHGNVLLDKELKDKMITEQDLINNIREKQLKEEK